MYTMLHNHTKIPSAAFDLAPHSKTTTFCLSFCLHPSSMNKLFRFNNIFRFRLHDSASNHWSRSKEEQQIYKFMSYSTCLPKTCCLVVLPSSTSLKDSRARSISRQDMIQFIITVYMIFRSFKTSLKICMVLMFCNDLYFYFFRTSRKP